MSDAPYRLLGFALLAVQEDGTRIVIYSADIDQAELTMEADIQLTSLPINDWRYTRTQYKHHVSIDANSIAIEVKTADLERLLSGADRPALPGDTEDTTP